MPLSDRRICLLFISRIGSAVHRLSKQQAHAQGGVDGETGMTRTGYIPRQLTWANNTAVSLCFSLCEESMKSL